MSTMIHDARRRNKRQAAEMRKAAEAKKAQRFERLLTAAMNHPAIKSRFFGDETITDGRVDLSIEEQLDLLESYARILEREYHEFIADFPDQQGQGAAKEFLDLRKDALEHIAHHRAGLVQASAESETGMIRPSAASLARIERRKQERDYQEKERVREARRGD